VDVEVPQSKFWTRGAQECGSGGEFGGGDIAYRDQY
jgi:hypothetical protein